MVIQHNITSMFAQRQLGITTDVKKKSTEKLSSGYRINRAADDAAGLAISEKMRRQIRGLTQNLDNIQDGVSFCQIADGYLQEVHDMIQRVNELGVKGANDTLTDEDREYIDMEVQGIKDEMQRIFDVASFNEMSIFRVPYSPSVIPHNEPYDTQVFYSGENRIGGLEFNNVRYNISELNSKGMKLNANGIATEDQKVEFDLFDGEHVKLTLGKGQSLDQIHREYNWKADTTGIYVNNKLATTWTDLGIAGDGHDEGYYSFDYHGMKVGFTIPERDDMADIMKGINGDGITAASYWDTSVSSMTTRPVVKYLSSGKLSASEANKGYFDHDFNLAASTSGLYVKDVTDDTGSSSVAYWSSFSNVGGAIDADETHSNYPIVDWGIDNDGNDASQITFDTEALYRYTGNNSDLPVTFDFKLADVASQPQVIDSINNTEITNSISCPAVLSYTGTGASDHTTDGTTLVMTNSRITTNNSEAFALQRDYGRNFDTNAALTGKIKWTTEYVDGSETDHSVPTTSNTYEIGRRDEVLDPVDYYYHDEETDTYWKYDRISEVSHKTYRTDEVYNWTKDYDITYEGNLGQVDLDEEAYRKTIGFARYYTYDFYQGDNHYVYSNGQQITDADEIQDIIDNGPGFETEFEADPDPIVIGMGDVRDDTVMEAGKFDKEIVFMKDADNPDDYALKFAHSITYDQLVNGSGGQSNLNLAFVNDRGEVTAASRAFTPKSKSRNVSEHDFNKIKVYPPEKKLIIQASPDNELQEQIELKWSSLNLNAIGMAGTNTLTASASKAAIEEAKEGIKKISEERGKFGAMQNRCEHAYKEVGVARENTQFSESLIRDTDMANEMVKFSNHNVLEQAGQTMLAQANQSKQGVLNLLQ